MNGMYRVLVADDEPLVCEGLSVLVDWGALGFSIEGFCKNGGEVLALLEREPYDLVITDIRMPVLDGINLISIVSSRWPATKLIIISGFNEFEYAKQALEYGVKGFIVKPIDRLELNKLLTKIKAELDTELGEQKSIEKLLDFGWDSDPLLTAIESCDLEKLGKEIRTLLEELENKKISGLKIEVIVYSILSRLNTLSKKYSFNFEGIAGNERISRLIKDNDHRAVSDFLLMLCTTLAGHIAEQTAIIDRNACRDVITEIKKYIDDNYKEDLHLKKIAQKFYINPIYLGRIFKNLTGESFNSYLNKLRIVEAKRLLAVTGMKVSEIIEAIGYNNSEYFYRVFRRYEGISFSDYRDRDYLIL